MAEVCATKAFQSWASLADVPDVDQVSEYLPMFLAEGREHLQELNLAVVRIEETPDDQATVDEIFRIAHSLKGMSATMGFAGMAALTHEMEDVFELLRQRKGGLERAEIDVLLECLDALEAAVDAIESGGAEAITPEPLIERLRTLVRDDEDAPDAEERRAGEHRAAGRPRASWPRAAASCRSPATLPPTTSTPVGARLHGARRRWPSWARRSPASRRPTTSTRFDGREVVAWLVSDRTDAELAEAAAARRRRSTTREVTEAVPDAAVDGAEEPGGRRRRRRAASPPGRLRRGRTTARRPSASTPSAWTS